MNQAVSNTIMIDFSHGAYLSSALNEYIDTPWSVSKDEIASKEGHVLDLPQDSDGD